MTWIKNFDRLGNSYTMKMSAHHWWMGQNRCLHMNVMWVIRTDIGTLKTHHSLEHVPWTLTQNECFMFLLTEKKNHPCINRGLQQTLTMITTCIDTTYRLFFSPKLARLQTNEAKLIVSDHIPTNLEDQLNLLSPTYHTNLTCFLVAFFFLLSVYSGQM